MPEPLSPTPSDYDRITDEMYAEYGQDIQRLQKKSEIMRDAVRKAPCRTPNKDRDGGERHLFEEPKSKNDAIQARFEANAIVPKLVASIVEKLDECGLDYPPPEGNRLFLLVEKLQYYTNIKPFDTCSAISELPAELLEAEGTLDLLGKGFAAFPDLDDDETPADQSKATQPQESNDKPTEWSIPMNLNKWADIFRVHRNTMRKYFRDQKTHNKKVSARKWAVDIGELPPEIVSRVRAKP